MTLFEQLASFFKSIKTVPAVLQPVAQPAVQTQLVGPKKIYPLAVVLTNVGVRPSRATEFAEPLVLAMQEFGIDTLLEQAAFLANGLHETLLLRYLREIWGPTPAQNKYENRPEMGNPNPGDGYKHRGGGFIHLTWGINYEKTGIAIGVDLKAYPERISEPIVAARSAGHFWKSHNCGMVLKEQGFKAVVKVVNGAYNGLNKREHLFDLLKQELSVV